jgi:hypothetical protein
LFFGRQILYKHFLFFPRFGLRDSPVPSDEEAKKKAPSDEEAKKKLPSAEEAKKKLPSAEEAKKKARLARFSPVSETDALEEEKRKARMIRYLSLPTVVPHIHL